MDPEHVRCPSCKLELELDESESLARKFKCPECDIEFRMDGESIESASKTMVEQGTLPSSFGDKIDYWMTPITLLILAGVILNPFSQREMPTSLGWIFLTIGVINTYRAIVSPKLTCLPCADNITKKIAVVLSLQEKFRWVLRSGQGGSFYFDDSDWFNPHEITLICTDDAYYFNCMVNAWRAGSGVSIYQTLKVAKAIRDISTKPMQSPVSGRLTSRSS